MSSYQYRNVVKRLALKDSFRGSASLILNISLFVGEISLGSFEGLLIDGITASSSLAQLKQKG